MTLSLPRGWWGYHWSTPHPRSIVELIRARTLDADLAALLWLLLEARLPVVVAARPPLAGKSTLLTALLDFLPPDTRLHLLRGWSEGFEWLPDAADLGWQPPADPLRKPATPGAHETWPPNAGPADPATAYLLASELSNHLPTYTWGPQARTAVRAAGRGYGLGATIHADSLAEVFEQLGEPPVSLTADDLRGLGIVLVLRMFRADGSLLDPAHGSRDVETAPLEGDVRRRVVAAHYVRPLERDAGGHVQRRPPAVLATWNRATDALDHFEWGIAAELAARVGRRTGDFEREQRARAAYLDGLATNGVVSREEVSRAIAGYATGRPAQTHPHHDHDQHRPRPATLPPNRPPAAPPASGANPLSIPPEPS